MVGCVGFGGEEIEREREFSTTEVSHSGELIERVLGTENMVLKSGRFSQPPPPKKLYSEVRWRFGNWWKLFLEIFRV